MCYYKISWFFFINDKKFISESQFGFCQISSKTDLHSKTTDEKTNMDKNLFKLTAILDMSKAFDFFSDDLLLRKLENIGCETLI